MKKLYYLGRPEDGYGWGIANTNLVSALSKLCNVVVTTPRDSFDAPVFSPIASADLKPLAKWKAPRSIGYCFTEWPIPKDAHRNARAFDVVFSGSNWNAQRLIEAGVKRVQVLQQGVDFERFKQTPLPEKGFVMFSGGKYEFRKGQDYVIAACKLFMKYRPDTVLITSWSNPWPESMKSMERSWLINPANPMDGLPADRCVHLKAQPNAELPQVYAYAHIGIFPNRCEAGTNLVMSEFMACGRPVIASMAHGHKDVLGGPGPYHLTSGSTDPAGWFNPNVCDILHSLEHAYNNRNQLSNRGEQCRKLIEPFTWSRCADKIFSAAFGE